MYDIGVALRRFKPLIRWTAYKFSFKLKMDFDDLEAEGFLTLVECCREFPKGETRFARYFKRAWYNRLHDFHRTIMFQKRQGIEVELTDALVKYEKRDDFYERMKSRYQELNPLLSQDAKKLLCALLDPPQEVVDYAYIDFCRKNKLASQGQPVMGSKRFRIRLRHIRKVLGMSSDRLRSVVKEVKTVNRSNPIGGFN